MLSDACVPWQPAQPVNIRQHVYACLCICVYVCARVYACLLLSLGMWGSMCMYVHVYVCVCVSVCVCARV